MRATSENLASCHSLAAHQAHPPRRSAPLIPAAYFGIVLGLGGFANSWRVAHRAWGASAAIGETIFALAAAAWIVVLALYSWKWIAAREAALIEARHPVQCCFIGLAGVATLLIAQGALPYSRALAIALFAAGATFTTGFGVWRTGLLWQGGRAVEATTSVLLLPVVAGGFVMAATAGAFGWPTWAGLAFGAALFSWLGIESVLLHRLYTAAPLLPALRPTLGIQLAPPSVGALAYLATGADPTSLVPQAFLGFALLQALLLLRLWPWITEQPFAPSYWAVTFGVTALPTALIKVSAASPSHAYSDLAFATFVASNLIMIVVVILTVFWVFRQKSAAP
ncbi:dicarboxylate transporter/tellurite-resistance protein TehA [Sphingomonas glacialis]|uniref:Dicarboxylate transporter/tellurite-resistance protein TehA n=1 Tax=Sphingomonas glacialis TaxID=658225 RepID=A0A502FTC6_9SPHN|nr:dicarboxylate transporter/tellurite-resistance protein TehA [Sphingomonas glacialis]TPG52639.1 dicarboxylate transporter/tellurite-resistance protein TehA [Sphingomonas glacialis]